MPAGVGWPIPVTDACSEAQLCLFTEANCEAQALVRVYGWEESTSGVINNFNNINKNTYAPYKHVFIL